jgi:arsenate reductase (thioredoxin)
MFALGLQGSPRRKGNSDLLLAMFMEALHQGGADTHTIQVVRRHIEPCKELTVCEKKGYCPIDDDMGREIYGLLRQADIIVAAAPIFFYNVPAQLKALIDRCQTLWARKYTLKLKDPGHAVRRGFLLGVGATRGKQLFDGMHLTAKYFFDAAAAVYAGSLTFHGVEGRGAILKQPDLEEQVARAADQLLDGLAGRRKVLFACRENACRSQMAAAFARLYAGRRLDVACAGSAPAPQINPMMVTAMDELGIDMAFLPTQSLEAAVARNRPDEIIVMGCDEQCPVLAGVRRQDWDLADPADQSMTVMRRVRDQIDEQVKAYIAE